MKTNLKQLYGRIKRPLLLLLIAVPGLLLAGRATAQTFTTLHSFTAIGVNSSFVDTNRDGASPEAGLILSGNTLYGTAFSGGTNGAGTVFAVNTNGTGFTNLYSFTATSASYPYTNSDGAFPYAGLILSGHTLYGAADSGGGSGYGKVFAINTDGTGFTNLHSFTALSGPASTNSDGAFPYAGLILSGNTLFGTSQDGGANGNGTVFAVNTNGMDFTNLYSFTATSGSAGVFAHGTNRDGANPSDGLILSGNTLYGTAREGGSLGNGTVFAVNTDGTGFTNLHNFTAASVNGGNSDGVAPFAGLILSGNTLYGTAQYGGTNGNGTVFAVNTNGMGFMTLHDFSATSTNFSRIYTNSDGTSPEAGLILSGNTLYGTAQYGGTNGNGTVFAVNTNGTGFIVLHAFAAFSGYEGISGSGTNRDGANPSDGLILSGNTLYGTASGGGTDGSGTVFGISYPSPQLTIILSGTNVIVTWPGGVAGYSYSGYNLQSTTVLVSPAVWSAVSPPPVVVNGVNTVTNPISGTRQFYRLSQ